MWRRQADARPSPGPPAPDPGVSRHAPAASSGPAHLSAAVRIKGDITGSEALYVDGELEGTIRVTESRVTIGPKARVVAEIEAEEIVVEGRVDGVLRARTRVELRRVGSVTGKMITPRLTIEEGAHFTGQVEMLRPEEARRASAAAAGAPGPSRGPSDSVA